MSFCFLSPDSVDNACREAAPQPSTSQASSRSQTPQPDALPKRKKRRMEYPQVTSAGAPQPEEAKEELEKLFLKTNSKKKNRSQIERNKAQTELAMLQKEKIILQIKMLTKQTLAMANNETQTE
ncbi:hypothetical protein BaRGS_00024122 [Batillaria attramentaria]|uniref:Uncharacterized protein n=1 Tax=Batillaria attramentaria TaxID=370345 RepID=A0ABD0KCA1_9CAEN